MRRDEHPIRRVNPSGKVRWVARYTGSDGKRHTAGTYAKEGPCKQPRPDGECCAQHRIWQAYETDQPRRGPVETVGEYFAVWLDRHPRGERTGLNYRGRVKSILTVPVENVAFAEYRMRDVRVRHVNDLIDVMLREHGRAASGVRGVLAVLSAMWRDAIGDDVAETNPFRDVRRLRDTDPRVQKPKRGVTIASWQDMHALARGAGEHEAMIRVLSDCGLRLGELLALHCRHVQGDVLVVEQTAWRGSVTPGTKQGERRLAPVPPVLQGLLAAVRRDRIGLLFPAPDGGVWHERSFYRHVWYPAVRASGVQLRPHDLRHSYVSRMRAAGVDPADLADAMGHTTDTATKVYTHGLGLSFEAMRGAVGE